MSSRMGGELTMQAAVYTRAVHGNESELSGVHRSSPEIRASEGGEPEYKMSKARLEAFSDGVIAILITIMVLELRPPHGADPAALRALASEFFTYVLSFVFLGIYWNNHHHLLHA